MLRLIGTFKGLSILSLRTGGVVGALHDPIINPNNLKIEGWYCEVAFDRSTRVLLTQDIREIIAQGFIVDDTEVLVEPEDLVRLKNLLQLNFDVLGKKVITTMKRNVGKVTDYSLDDRSMTIQKLYVGQSILKSLSGGRVIDRRQIVEITNKSIIVKDTEIKSPLKSSVLQPSPVTPILSSSSASTALTKE